jgi:heme-degrading monooxygenase HmoA
MMKKTKNIALFASLLIVLASFAKINSRPNNTKKETKMETNQSTQEHADTQYLIDRISVPAKAIQEFKERMKLNRNFIKTLPGFIEDDAYLQTDQNGNVMCVTVAVWKSKEAIQKAKEAVQAEYKKEGFDMPAMLKRLGIVIDRGVYQKDSK